MLWLCVLIKCLAAAISSTVTTHGWLSSLVVVFTVDTLPASRCFNHGSSSSICVCSSDPSITPSAPASLALSERRISFSTETRFLPRYIPSCISTSSSYAS
uniref:Putative secreted protein n=1 Tax=Anopheles darlingi TaxID=43151 RepID=A0A2M4DD82_ANODA